MVPWYNLRLTGYTPLFIFECLDHSDDRHRMKRVETLTVCELDDKI